MRQLGQGHVCQCFYFGNSNDLFKPSNPTWCRQHSQHRSVWLSRLSAFCASVGWCVSHTQPRRCTNTRVSVSRVHVVYAPVHGTSSSLICRRPLLCSAVGKTTAPGRYVIYQSVVHYAKWAPEGTIPVSKCNSFLSSYLIPNGRWMLTVFALSSLMHEWVCVCVCVDHMGAGCDTP